MPIILKKIVAYKLYVQPTLDVIKTDRIGYGKSPLQNTSLNSKE